MPDMASQNKVNKPDYDAGTNPNSYYLDSKTSGQYQVEFREWPNGYNESHSTNEGTEYTRVLGCYWNQRNAFLMDLLGTCRANPDGSLSRTLPEFFPGRSDFCCIDAKFLRWSGTPDFNTSDEPTLMTVSALLPPFTPGTDTTGGGGPGYAGDGFAWYTTTWRKPLYAVLSDAQTADAATASPTLNTTPELARFVYRKPTFAGDTLPIPGTTYKYVNLPLTGATQTPIMDTVSKNNLWTEWTYAWFKVPVFPQSAVLACQGKVNSVTFDGADPQTMLFESVDFTDPYADVLGNLFQNIFFKIREVVRTNVNTATAGYTKGHNLYFRPVNKKWEDFSIDGSMSLADGNRKYDQADLNTLFLAKP